MGSCGAGKSTLARTLGEKLNLPVIHLDVYYWQPEWQETDKIVQKTATPGCQ
ncbi:MAG: shikimate kinase [Pleurocapsa sp. MO_192.B19]|nr:shikimate kinase [Pleurocapsa sp. MO_192.B19]